MCLFVMYLAQGDDGLAVLGIEDLAHCVIDSGQTTENALKAGDHCDHMVAGFEAIF